MEHKFKHLKFIYRATIKLNNLIRPNFLQLLQTYLLLVERAPDDGASRAYGAESTGVLGRAYFETEAFEDAEMALGRSVEVDPSCSTSPRLQNAWRLRGETRARLGYRDDALTDFERCVELGPESPDGRACQRQLDAAQ